MLPGSAALMILAAREVAAEPAGFAEHIQKEYTAARQRHQAEPTNAVAVWEFARASYDRAELATNNTERAAIAEQGIKACRLLLARDLKSAPGHYYLGMNLGQLARTKALGALRIVDEMEREFKMAQALDEQLDHAGPDRNLGRLYRDAPSIGSIGNRNRARLHLARAVELAPGYPENRLRLVEALLHWGEHHRVNQELAALNKLWPEARAAFTGITWAESWRDWEARLQRARKEVEERGPGIESPRR